MAPAAAEKVERKPNPLVKAYLVLYNVASLVGWVYFLTQVVQHFANGGRIDTLWAAVGDTLKVVQTAAVLEIAHSALGLVRSPLATAFVQVASRLIVLWAIVNVAPPAQVSPFFALMAAAWGLVEPPRYLSYTLAELGVEAPYALTWVRYSAFIVLYPAGITGEFGSLVTAFPYVRDHQVWAISQPNKHNFVYAHWVTLILLALLYVPGSPFMIGHMWRQRVQRLGPKSGVKKD